MQLTTTKQDFEAAVPAAREPKGKIFAVMEDAIAIEVDHIGSVVLGTPGIQVVESGEGALADQLRRLTRHVACISAFLSEMRGLDLVLTATGFGVVSTQDTAPASKQRVDALDGELRRKAYRLTSELITALFGVQGWNETDQRYVCVETLFYSFDMLERFAAISRPKPEDWDNNKPAMRTADIVLRKHIGHNYMGELCSQLASNSLTPANRTIATLCQQFIGAWIAQDKKLKEETFQLIVNTLEENSEDYPTYMASKAYLLNHFKPYENNAEDSAFHFVG